MTTRVRNIRTCSVAECEQVTGVPGTAKGLCCTHYQRMKKHGHTDSIPRVRNNCTIDDCDAFVTGHGWCMKHYTRWQRYGNPAHRMPGEIVGGKRICPRCNLDLPVDRYSPNKSYRSGLSPYCKPCAAAIVQTWRKRTGYKSPPAPAILSRARAKAWRKKNPDKVRSATAARRARRRGALVETFSAGEIFERDKWMCHICAVAIDPSAKYPDPLSASLDHVIPLAAGVARGGVHSRANCAASHLVCNLRKQAKLVGV